MCRCSSVSAEHFLVLQEFNLIAAGKLWVLAGGAWDLTDMAQRWGASAAVQVGFF